ncbi:MAG TPA: uroporphyrinogen-III synthase [Salinisphaeraceae bacterium]|nr:uroporphyrinogen-III synthase [Salinisphaeraceae bacterium]
MSQAASQTPLAGRRVWLTRPAHQAAAWAAGLTQAGARVACEPLLEIVPPAQLDAARRQLARAEQADIIIATSPNAVAAAWRMRPRFAPRGVLCAVGAASAAALQQASGRSVHAPAAGDTSEDLLAIPALADVAGHQIMLLSGAGGRRKLMQALSARGAQVSKAALYRRQPAVISRQRLATLAQDNDSAVITSGEALEHLCALARRHGQQPGLHAALAGLQLVVPSQRVVQHVPADLFPCPPRVAARMTVAAVVAALAPGA